MKHDADVEAADRPASRSSSSASISTASALTSTQRFARSPRIGWIGRSKNYLERHLRLAAVGLERMGGYKKLHRYPVTQRALFLAAPPIRTAPAALRSLNEAGIHIRAITNRLSIKYFHEHAVTQTIRWLDLHGIAIAISAYCPTREGLRVHPSGNHQRRERVPALVQACGISLPATIARGSLDAGGGHLPDMQEYCFVKLSNGSTRSGADGQNAD